MISSKLTLWMWMALFIVSCSKKKPESVRLFYGACKVEVVSQTHDAEIFIDGIHVGEDHALVEIPCGEKQVTVTKHGYVPYRAYLPATAQQPLKVTVALEKSKSHSDYALSSELITQVRDGKALIDPHGGPEQKAFAIRYAELRKTAEAAAVQAAGGGAASGAAGGAASESWDSVEDWR